MTAPAAVPPSVSTSAHVPVPAPSQKTFTAPVLVSFISTAAVLAPALAPTSRFLKAPATSRKITIY